MSIRNQTKILNRIVITMVFLLTAVVLLTALYKLATKPHERVDAPPLNITKLMWYVDDYNLENTWGKDVTSKLLIEKTGLAVQFITSRTTNEEYLSVILAGRSAPDLVTLRNHSPQINKMINEGKAADLTALISLLDSDSKYRAYLESSRYEGQLFICPGIVGSEVNGLYHLYDIPALIVREDLYDLMGSPDMTTPQGFLEALASVQGSDVIPLGLDEFTDTGCDSIDNILMQFLAVPYYQDKQAYDRYRDPSLQEWILCLSHAYRLGFLQQDALLDSEDQIRHKLASGMYFAFMANAAKFELELQQSPYRYIAVEAPRNLSGDDPTLLSETSQVGKYATLVNASSQHIESAMTLLSYLAREEGQTDAYLGRVDVTYSKSSVGINLKSHAIDMRDASRSNYQSIYGGLFTYFMLANLNSIKDYPSYRSSVLQQPYEWRAQYTVPAPQLGVIKLDLNQARGSQILLISQKWGQQLPFLVASANDQAFLQAYQAFLDMRDDMGHQEIQAALTQLFTREQTP